MTVCTYLDPVDVHPDRHGRTRPMPPRWIVVHTSEQTHEGPNAASDLATYLTRPGDRPTSGGGLYGSSYHDIIDVDRTVRQAVPHDTVSYSAPGSNTEGLHVCLPGRAGQDLAGWSDGYSSALIDTLAGYIVDQCSAYNINPVAPLAVSELLAGDSGITDHARIGEAFGRTDHTDIGAHFPWPRLTALINDLISTPIPPPKETPTMNDIGIVAIYAPSAELRQTGRNKIFGLLPGGDVRHLTGPDTQLDRPRFEIAGVEHYKQCQDLDAIWRNRR